MTLSDRSVKNELDKSRLDCLLDPREGDGLGIPPPAVKLTEGLAGSDFFEFYFKAGDEAEGPPAAG